jgi:hypothetical protein
MHNNTNHDPQELPLTLLEKLLASIPQDFQYPSDVQDFIDSPPVAKELL